MMMVGLGWIALVWAVVPTAVGERGAFDVYETAAVKADGGIAIGLADEIEILANGRRTKLVFSAQADLFGEAADGRSRMRAMA